MSETNGSGGWQPPAAVRRTRRDGWIWLAGDWRHGVRSGWHWFRVLTADPLPACGSAAATDGAHELADTPPDGAAACQACREAAAGKATP